MNNTMELREEKKKYLKSPIIKKMSIGVGILLLIGLILVPWSKLSFDSPSDIIMDISIGLMGILSVWYLIRIFTKPDYQSYIPEAVGAIGMIGTFGGIVIGLLNFDTTHLEQSVPNLLEGMKVAFITSLVGLVVSTILKLISVKIKAIENEFDNETTIEDKLGELIQLMKNSDNSIIAESILELKEVSIETNKMQQEGTKLNIESMKKMEKSIVSLMSDDENSLISQMKYLRKDLTKSQEKSEASLNKGLENMNVKLSDLVNSNNAISKEIERGNKELIGNFIDFRDEMAKAFTEEFTQALTRSIEDLNNQLQEQLGENFKNAVNKLVDWQEHYIETIKNTTIVLDKTLETIRGTEKSLENISNRSESLVRVSEELKPTIEGLDSIQSGLKLSISDLNVATKEFKTNVPELLQINEDLTNKSLNKINIVLDNLSDMGVGFEEEINKTAIKLKENSNNLTEGIDKSITAVINNSNNLLETANKITIKSQDKLEVLEEDMRLLLVESINSMKANGNLMSATASEQFDNIEEVSQKIATSYEQLLVELSNNLMEIFKKSGKTMNDSVAHLEETLENNIDNSLSSLTGALSQVSEKFVSDYTPLTKKLREVVKIAEGVK